MLLPVVALVAVLSLVTEPLVSETVITQTPQRAQPAAAPTQPVLTGDTERNQGRTVRICRNERVTGSNLPRRVCRNRFQSSAAEQATREMLRQMQGARVAPAT